MPAPYSLDELDSLQGRRRAFREPRNASESDRGYVVTVRGKAEGIIFRDH